MIKIDHEDIDTVKKSFFTGLRPIINKLLGFHIAALNVIIDPLHDMTDLLVLAAPMDKRTVTSYLRWFLTNKKQICAAADWNLLQDTTVIDPYYLTYAADLKGLFTDLLDESTLETLLLGPPQDLMATETGHHFLGWNNDLVKPLLNHVLNYVDFTEKDNYTYDGFSLAGDLQVNVCPYCNRTYTSTIHPKPNGAKISRPTFDHFFDKATYPLLALSFYNLIPSCNLCNSYLKSTHAFNLDDHLHPYLGGFGKEVRFDYDQRKLMPQKSHPNNFSVKVTIGTISPAKLRRVKGDPAVTHSGSMNIFKTAETYQSHADSVGEIVVKADSNSPYYVSTLRELFNKIAATDEEFYRFYFGNYFNEADFNRRPLAKLTRDIVSKLIPELDYN